MTLTLEQDPLAQVTRRAILDVPVSVYILGRVKQEMGTAGLSIPLILKYVAQLAASPLAQSKT